MPSSEEKCKRCGAGGSRPRGLKSGDSGIVLEFIRACWPLHAEDSGEVESRLIYEVS